MPILPLLQSTIQSLHDVQVDLDVSAYMVDDVARRDLPGAREELPEQLFVREVDEALEIALYIAPTIVSALEADDPHTRLHAGNLENFCIALEGVSHFVFLAWRASVGWPVSALEMEIQAEVDKFISAWMLLTGQGVDPAHSASALQRQLFRAYELRDELSPEEVDRYHTASRVAEGFCRGLVRRNGDSLSSQRIMREARTFYRKPLAQKLRVA